MSASATELIEASGWHVGNTALLEHWSKNYEVRRLLCRLKYVLFRVAGNGNNKVSSFRLRVLCENLLHNSPYFDWSEVVGSQVNAIRVHRKSNIGP